jgi:inward rectifier potassium channel
MADIGSTRVFSHARRGVKIIGLERRPLADLYHRLATGSWTRLVLVYAAVFFAAQALFGVAHLALAAEWPPGAAVLPALLAVADAPPAPAPPLSGRWIAAGAVSAAEAFVRWLLVVIGAGILLAKYSRIPARVMFSDVAVVGPHAGGRALTFRMANERTSHILDAKASVMLVRNEPGEDGEVVRRAHDLPLARGGSALFSHAWTAVHPIGRESPLFGATEASLAAEDAELVVTLSGFDEGLTRVIHARRTYLPEDLRWDVRFREIVKVLPSGERAVDYRRFHDVAAIDPPGERATPRSRAAR